MDRVALVTGGTGYIGQEIVRAVASSGYNVLFTYKSRGDDAVALEHEIEKSGRRALALQLDLSEEIDFEDFVYSAERKMGRISLLILSASRFQKPREDVKNPEGARDIFTVNMISQFLLASSTASRMKVHGEGTIIFILDSAGERIFPRFLPYSVSKSACYSMVRGFAKEYAPEVLVNGVSPGIIRLPGDMDEEGEKELLRKIPARDFGSREDVVRAVMFLAGAPGYITGEVIGVDGGYGL